jgi:histidinol dehydrogenase
MTVVPAQMAGVPRIVIASPPGKNGQVNPLVLGVAHLLGIDEVYAIGGAQAIAALTFGTDSVPRVDKIVGPGNAFVNEAKRQVYGTVGIDSLAGPTEVVILADDSAKPMEIARDLFAQAEHDPDARSLLVTDSRSLASAVQFQCNELITHVPRNEIIRASLDRFGGIILVSDLEEGIAVVNELATEHLQIMTRNADELVNSIQNAGAIFVGSDTPVAAGDYCAGPNHVLPTQKNARFSSPLNVLDFMKFSSVLKFSKERLTQAGPAMARFADLEGLPNHKFSIECRHD